MQKIIFVVLFFLLKTSIAQKEPIERTWWNEEKTSKIQIFRSSDGKFYGKIIFLQELNDTNGKPKTDKNNPSDQLKNRSIINLIILQNFVKSSHPNIYEDGAVYDPQSGKTYCGKLTFNGKELKLRGYICGFSLLGRSAVWTLAD